MRFHHTELSWPPHTREKTACTRRLSRSRWRSLTARRCNLPYHNDQPIQASGKPCRMVHRSERAHVRIGQRPQASKQATGSNPSINRNHHS
ncbi:unnamed protein product [Periconia digitata]|uniref:Uncharacterized protein n=1 Tax=Periconia digitata TaxID=1303443 RepID=A0A9W4XLL3_9PLEO|nr:unnamed protein product [Periconia digitata]